MVTASVAPFAACTIKASGEVGERKPLQIAADQFGSVQFYVESHSDPASAEATTLFLSCQTSEGRLSEQKLRIDTVSTGESQDTPVDRSVSDVVREPLSGDLSAISQEELVSRGFPLRPDVHDVDAYAKWAEHVMQPARIASSRVVTTPGRRHAAVDGYRWCGHVIAQPNATYDVSGANWYVPYVFETGLPVDKVYYSTVWTGLGGYKQGDDSLIQAGTDQIVLHLYIPPYQDIVLSWYSAWVEYLPNASATVSLAVEPGDFMYVQTWAGNSSGARDASGPYGWFYLANATKGTTLMTSVARPAGATFVGRSAEWILERPTVDGDSTILPKFFPTPLSSAFAWQPGVYDDTPLGNGFV